jgi:catechol 2,3-dioxygenase-like lactoylglutathione lyase family enzyme
MSSTQVRSETAIETPRARRVDMKLEVVVIPVSDVDRAKRFYSNLGWRLDADFVRGDEFRVVQFTPPGSSCSIHFGTGVTSAVPGSAQGLYLIVSDIEYFHQVDKGGHFAAWEEPELFSAELRAAFRPLRKLI